MSREETTQILAKANVSPVEAIIDFQTRFGGYVLDSETTLGICAPEASGRWPLSPTIEDDEGKRYFTCVLPNRYQIRREIDNAGTYFEDGVAYAESFDTLIQHFAYLHFAMRDTEWIEIGPDRLATKRFAGILDETNLSLVPIASDQYRQVLRSEEMLYIRTPQASRLFVTPRHAKEIGRRR